MQCVKGMNPKETVNLHFLHNTSPIEQVIPAFSLKQTPFQNVPPNSHGSVLSGTGLLLQRRPNIEFLCRLKAGKVVALAKSALAKRFFTIWKAATVIAS